ncbi:MAG TPA: hypothetical protein VFS43_39305 [Polyangiaceae bacterium]|nr:hypothetical protein [Polyangiaceae bacterium]
MAGPPPPPSPPPPPPGGAPARRERLADALTALCEDLCFALAASAGADEAAFRAIAERRAPAYEALLRGEPALRPAALGPWLGALCQALAPVTAPAWLPMGELVARGVTLAGGARGPRALFTSKPSDKETQRVRRLGTLALRVMGAVMGADGAFTPEEQRQRAAFVACLGLPDDEARHLLAEAPLPAPQVDVLGELDPKLAPLLVRGAWLAAAHDGIDPREEEAIAVLAGKLALPLQDAVNLRAEVRAELDARQTFGRAALDAIRLVLGDQALPAALFAALIAELAIPASGRPEAVASLTGPAPAALSDRLPLDKKAKGAVLAVAWAAALAANPTLVLRVELARRHDRAATELGTVGEGPRVREALDHFAYDQLGLLKGPD